MHGGAPEQKHEVSLTRHLGRTTSRDQVLKRITADMLAFWTASPRDGYLCCSTLSPSWLQGQTMFKKWCDAGSLINQEIPANTLSSLLPPPEKSQPHTGYCHASKMWSVIANICAYMVMIHQLENRNHMSARSVTLRQE